MCASLPAVPVALQVEMAALLAEVVALEEEAKAK